MSRSLKCYGRDCAPILASWNFWYLAWQSTRASRRIRTQLLTRMRWPRINISARYWLQKFYHKSWLDCLTSRRLDGHVAQSGCFRKWWIRGLCRSRRPCISIRILQMPFSVELQIADTYPYFHTSSRAWMARTSFGHMCFIQTSSIHWTENREVYLKMKPLPSTTCNHSIVILPNSLINIK